MMKNYRLTIVTLYDSIQYYFSTELQALRAYDGTTISALRVFLHKLAGISQWQLIQKRG